MCCECKIKLNNINEIEIFCNYFNDRIAEIEKIESRILKKVLFVSVLDSLSNLMESDTTGNKINFTKFIRNFANWKDSQKISLPLLYQHIRNNSITFEEDKEVIPFLEDKYKLIKYGLIHRLDEDITIDDIRLKIGGELSKKANNEIMRFEHANIFYVYRNYLVHEFREPNFSGLENIPTNETPYYIGGDINISKQQTNWKLVYSEHFFIELVKSSLSAIKKYLIDNNKNPYECYDFEKIL